MNKTLEELAQELVISKGQLKKLLNQMGIVDVGKTGLSDKQVKFIRLIVSSQRQRQQEKITAESYEEQILEESVEERGFPSVGEFVLEQLEQKDRTITQLQKLLDQQQQLSLEDKRMLRFFSSQLIENTREFISSEQIPFLDEQIVEKLVLENKQLKQENLRLKQKEIRLTEEKQRVTENLNHWMNYYADLQEKYDKATAGQTSFLKKRWSFK
ncbi:DUF536 domain-containing protein [Enterococcus pallens]|uniref:Regulator of chromosome segregation-like C-terminal domain-containing protein n=1 Tax=Enterococcus pallens ATCC BAA-351 TaxID=1158607 RepID=R2TCP3_9ENTE|nr:DUF536 domain-containing protein [Enterococcus pallens]EOH97959.1 hypothetical protein UAU_00628 [Enterococcus pallens ATCC BAA-351]EOU20622.1 hypothetical protein I588_01468 [Enterococcus pallens ATCC BAA-351]OJG80351.1 hypothetical protein RV10_GL004563 [Enterococcus pallens]